MGAYPKPDDAKVTRTPQKHGWIDLPAAGREGPTPDLPSRPPGYDLWSAPTLEWWGRLWAKPQATQWDLDDASMFRLAALHERFWRGDGTAAEMNEARQIEDRHGLNPKSMLQLLWRVSGGPESEEKRPARASRKASDRKTRALKVLDGGG